MLVDSDLKSDAGESGAYLTDFKMPNQIKRACQSAITLTKLNRIKC